MDNSKKGLAVLYDPNSLRQFVWYFTTKSPNIKWDVLCLPNGEKGTYIDKDCIRAEVFERIYRGETDYMKLPLKKKFFLFLRLLLFWVLKKQKLMAEELINSYVSDIEMYDEYVTNTDTGFVSGLLSQFATIKEVVYLDDGSWDYLARSKWKCTFKSFSFEYWQGFVMSKMGYCSKGRFYFEPTKYCTKYCNMPDKMRYKNYRQIKGFSFEETRKELYDTIIEKIYPDIKRYDFSRVDTVIFTDPWDDFTTKPEKYIHMVEEYVSKNASVILLKKHPRDKYNYSFKECECIEVDQTVPAEIMLPFLKGKKLLFFVQNSIMISISDGDYIIDVFFFDNLGAGRDAAVARKYYSTENDLRRDLEDVNCNKVKIIHL